MGPAVRRSSDLVWPHSPGLRWPSGALHSQFMMTIRISLPKPAWLITALGLSLWTASAQEQSSETETPAAKSAPVGPPNTSRDLYESIVEIECASLVPDYQQPWNGGRETGGTGTGFMIAPNKFVTNAHVVADNTRLLIKKYGDPEKYAAKLLHIAHDCDLAILECSDPIPFADAKPLDIGDIPKLESTVTVIGYPLGGRRLSTTRGVVSRIDFQPYSHSGADLHLAIQIDAAINPGNSGGPVLQEGKVVGVAFQGISGAVAQNVGYMIPTPVLRRFLHDIEDGQYDRYVDLAIGDFDLINPAQRLALGLEPDSSVGTLVASVSNSGSCDGMLEEGDVLLSIDGREIASNGYVEVDGEFVNMNEIVERRFKGDKVDMKILRDGQPKSVEIELKPFDPYLIQANTYDKRPRYATFAGLTFQPLDRNLMAAHNIESMAARYLYTFYVQDELFDERPEIVVLTSILPDAINSNFGGFQHSVVDKINDQKIKNLQDLYDALHPAEVPEFYVIEFFGKGLPIVVESARVEAADKRIRATYEVGLDSYLGSAEDDVPVIFN
jgi:S1-C subfamily serine protease